MKRIQLMLREYVLRVLSLEGSPTARSHTEYKYAHTITDVAHQAHQARPARPARRGWMQRARVGGHRRRPLHAWNRSPRTRRCYMRLLKGAKRVSKHRPFKTTHYRAYVGQTGITLQDGVETTQLPACVVGHTGILAGSFYSEGYGRTSAEFGVGCEDAK